MRYKNLFIFLLVQLACTFNIEAQKLDLLLNELNKHKKEDTVKLHLLNNITREYLHSNITKALQTADTAIVLAKNLNDQSGLAVAYLLKGENYFIQNMYVQDSALTQQSFTIFEQLGNKKGMASCLTDMGAISLRMGDYHKAAEYYKKAININEQLDNRSELASDFNGLGATYRNLSDYPKALEAFQKSVNIYDGLNEKVAMSDPLSNIGNVYIILSDYPLGLTFCQRALKIQEQFGNSERMANTLMTIGILNMDLADYPKALEYFRKALIIDAQIGVRDTSYILTNIGFVYEKMSQIDNAIKYSLESIEVSERLGTVKGLTSSLNDLGFLYYERSDFLKAWDCYKKALSIGEQTGDKDNTAVVQLSIGELYRDAPDSILIHIGIRPEERYSKTLEYLSKGKQAATEVGSLVNQRYAWEDLSIMYEKKKDFSDAFDAYKKYIVLRDKIVNNEKDKKISRLAMQYEFDKKKDSLNLQQQVTDEKLKQQLLFAKQQQQQLELNQKKLALSNKEKDLQKLAYLKTQADLQNEQLEKKGKEKQLTISEKEKQLQQANVKTLIQEKHLNSLRQQQQWIYIIGGLIFLGFVSSWFFYRARLQQVRLKTQIAAERIEQQQKEAEFQRQLGDISLSALRSQMNPHFIFNCLNSIKLYTTENNTVAASDYLTKFSRLIRLVLENSRSDRITLASELNALRLYMEMEAMRFKEKLKYNISVEANVDLDYIEIPPLLLQPYVENAIWHGLMQKEEGGRIDITVGMVHNESVLAISIIDNGIGRAKSAELNSKTATKHKSYGMKVTSERLALINQIYKSGAHVTIHDIADDNGQPGGTQVTIKIPID